MFFFALWAGPAPPPKQQKIKHAPAQTAKKNDTRNAQTTKKTRQQKINTLTGTAQSKTSRELVGKQSQDAAGTNIPYEHDWAAVSFLFGARSGS